MQEILVQLNRVRGVGGSALVSAEGLLMESSLRQGSDESALAAAVGALIDHGQRLAQQLNLGKPASFQAGSDQGGLLIFATGPAWLVLVVDPAANQTMLQLEAKPFIERIAQRLSL